MMTKRANLLAHEPPFVSMDERFSAASFKASMEEQGIAVSRNQLTSLIENMQALSKQWRRSIGKHGELVFYVDAS